MKAPTPRGRRQLFVYWRVDATRLTDALDAVQAFQRTLLQTQPALVAQLYQRSDDPERPTLMETYAVRADSPGRHGNGLDDDTIAAIEQQAEPLTRLWRIGARHLELFDLVMR